jgi:hypothetical protein
MKTASVKETGRKKKIKGKWVKRTACIQKSQR